MNILFPNWKTFGLNDIKEVFESLGHTVVMYQPEPKDFRLDPRFKSELKKCLRDKNIDLVFTSNYYPVISDACQSLNIPYASWCYDSPLILTLSKTIQNPCNHVFLFDSQMAEDLQKFTKHVYYLPMAVNAEHLKKLKPTDWQRKHFAADVSFVGSLYTEKHTLYDRMTDLDEKTRGYLDGIMRAQQLIYGYNFLENVLTPEIIENMLSAMPIKLHRDGLETYEYVYANYFLCRKITQTERTELLSSISEALPQMTTQEGTKPMPLKLYTPGATPALPLVKNMGPVDYLKDMPLVFSLSKINLNISLRSIKNGIPLRAMDIMGAGGFLLSNYQRDFERHFTDGEDYISYNSREDLLAKIEYYLGHEKEREEIAKNGCEKVRREHTYEKRITEMLKTVEESV